jgi:hypothetical protein
MAGPPAPHAYLPKANATIAMRLTTTDVRNRSRELTE